MNRKIKSNWPRNRIKYIGAALLVLLTVVNVLMWTSYAETWTEEICSLSLSYCATFDTKAMADSYVRAVQHTCWNFMQEYDDVNLLKSIVKYSVKNVTFYAVQCQLDCYDVYEVSNRVYLGLGIVVIDAVVVGAVLCAISDNDDEKHEKETTEQETRDMTRKRD